MNRKVVLLITWVIVFIGMTSVTISTEFSVGVEEGDWMEYKGTVTGTPPLYYTYPQFERPTNQQYTHSIT